MFKLKITAVLLMSVFVLGCGASNELRIDDFTFGNSRVGLQAERPVFKVGEKIFLNYAIRGFQPDSEGNAKLSHQISVTGIEEALVEDKDIVFKVNSEITSYGPGKPITLSFGKKQLGTGVFRFVVTDEVAQKDLIKEIPYEVTL